MLDGHDDDESVDWGDDFAVDESEDYTLSSDDESDADAATTGQSRRMQTHDNEDNENEDDGPEAPFDLDSVLEAPLEENKDGPSVSRLTTCYKPLSSRTFSFQREEIPRKQEGSTATPQLDHPRRRRRKTHRGTKGRSWRARHCNANDGSADSSGDGVPPPSSGDMSGDGDRSGNSDMCSDGDKTGSGVGDEDPPSSGDMSGDGDRSGNSDMCSDGDKTSSGVGDGVLPPSSGDMPDDGDIPGNSEMCSDGDKTSSGVGSSPPQRSSASSNTSTNHNGPSPKNMGRPKSGHKKKKKTKNKKTKDNKSKNKNAKNKNTKNKNTKNTKTRVKSRGGAKDNVGPTTQRTRKGKGRGRRGGWKNPNPKKVLNDMCHLMFDWAAAILDRGEQAKRSLRLVEDLEGTA